MRKLLQQLFEWGKRVDNTHGLWRWLSYVLTLAGLMFVGVVLVQNGQQLRHLSWRSYAPAVLLTLLLHLASFLFQLFVWMRLISFHHAVGWRDVEIYSRMVLLRSIPGGIWHWIGRAAMYRAATAVPGQVVIAANLAEWGLLMLAAVGVHFGTRLGMSAWWGGPMLAAFLVALGLTLRWQPVSRALGWRLLEGGLWILLYATAWLFGGVIIGLFVKASGGEGLGLMEATQAWTFTGGLGLLTSIIPVGFFVREITLSLLLTPYVPSAVALAVTLIIRVLFTLADTAWGCLGWLLARYASPDIRREHQARL